jgi:hypothetical protein
VDVSRGDASPEIRKGSGCERLEFKPGQSGNPGGRPKVVAEVRDLARQYGRGALSTLADIMLNKKCPPAARVAAANVFLDRGYGKPAQHVEAHVSLLDRPTDKQRDSLMEALKVFDYFEHEDERRH